MEVTGTQSDKTGVTRIAERPLAVDGSFEWYPVSPVILPSTVSLSWCTIPGHFLLRFVMKPERERKGRLGKSVGEDLSDHEL